MRSPDEGADSVSVDRTSLHSRRDTAGRPMRDARLIRFMTVTALADLRQLLQVRRCLASKRRQTDGTCTVDGERE